jgi:hypothetical protein
MATKSCFLRRDSDEWHNAWNSLCPDGDFNAGEWWQYMSTEYDSLRCGWVHQFRNRWLNGRRQYRNIPATVPPIAAYESEYEVYAEKVGDFADPVLIKTRNGYESRLTFREEECGGVFDGFSVSSDADSGL